MANTHVTLYGNLVADPELRYSANGKAICNFTIAENTIRMDGSKGDTNYYDCTAWETQAENVSASLKKGDRAVVIGRLKHDRWEKDGVKRSKFSITADDVAASLRWATATVHKTQKVASAAAANEGAFDDDLLL